MFGLGDNKVYDGTTTATVSGLLPDVTDAPPPVTLGPVSDANFDTRHVGTDKAITFASTFSNATYDLFATATAPAGTYQARADITPRPLAVNAVTDARMYNGTTSSVGVPTVTGLQAGDTLDGALTQAFASKDVLGVGASTLVASGSYSVSDGNGGNNYSVSVLMAPGTISPVPLTITAQDVSKVYGQTPVLSAFDASALVNGETVGSVTLVSAGQVATASVAGSPYAIVPSNATGGTFTPGNYSISYVNGALAVTPAPVVPPVEPPVVEPPAEPPVVVVPVEPPVVVPPVEPPVVVPPVEPPVVVPPVEPPVVVVPVEPPVVVPPPEPPVASTEPAPSATSEKQALPTMPSRDARPVLLTVMPPVPLAQGPVTQASPRNVSPVPVPLQTPTPPPVPAPAAPAPVPVPVVPPVVQEEVKPQLPLPVAAPRRPKQDRN